MTKAEVLSLQREINEKTGFKLAEDGIYGPATAEAYQYYIDQITPRRVPTPVPLPPKPWWASRAIWGLIATLVAGAAQRYGYEVDQDGLTNLFLQIIEVGGLALAVYGTLSRRQPISIAGHSGGLRLPGGSSGVPSAGQADERKNPFLD